MSILQAFQIRSAYLFVNMAVIGLLPLVCNEVYNLATGKHAQVHFGLVHWFWTALSMPMIVEASTSVGLLSCSDWSRSLTANLIALSSLISSYH